MAPRVKKQKNRFLPGAHVSESTLARILFCWLNGELYSAIPEAITQEGGAVDAAIDELRMLMGEKFQLANNQKQTISRQACHSIIDSVSVKVIVRHYIDTRDQFAELMDEDVSKLLDRHKHLLTLLDPTLSDEEKINVLSRLRDQSINEFTKSWKGIVLSLSANKVPYEELRALRGAKPYDLTENRGYRASAMKSHVAHNLCLDAGADYMNLDLGHRDRTSLHNATDEERADYWFKCVVRSLACLLVQLETGTTYRKLRGEVLKGAR
jgi:hypothetical protein